MKKIAIVTGSDKNYFPFLKNLALSLKLSKSLDLCDLCILKVDQNTEYLDELKDMITKSCDANFKLKVFFDEKKNWHKLLTERPFIKDYFPGYKKYIWLDADTEVLNLDGIKFLDDATEEKELAIAPEVNESYIFKNKSFGLKKIFSSFYKISGWSFKNYNKYFGNKLGENLFFKPLFNNGVFCLRSDSKIWDLWKFEYQSALKKAKTSYGIKTDQLSLNKVIYENFRLISILDSTNNWIVAKSELLRKQNCLFFTPSFPRRKINIIHYTNFSYKDFFRVIENGEIKNLPIIKDCYDN